MNIIKEKIASSHQQIEKHLPLPNKKKKTKPLFNDIIMEMQ